MFKIAKQVWVINYDHALISNRPGFPVPGIPVPGLAILSYPGPGQVTFFIPVPVPVPVKCWFIIPVPVPVNSGFLVPVPVPVRPKIMSRSITDFKPHIILVYVQLSEAEIEDCGMRKRAWPLAEISQQEKKLRAFFDYIQYIMHPHRPTNEFIDFNTILQMKSLNWPD